MSRTLYACAHAAEFPAQALLRLRPDLRSKPVAVLEGQPHPGTTQIGGAGLAEAGTSAYHHGHAAVEVRPFVQKAHCRSPVSSAITITCVRPDPCQPGTTSITVAEPMPPPAHMAATPMPPPLRARS